MKFSKVSSVISHSGIRRQGNGLVVGSAFHEAGKRSNTKIAALGARIKWVQEEFSQ